ncbi:bifunctional protein-serine/threonine kinase/phosphatase [Microbulbifer zhoushanensis]|uniref:bifunctional protein-serine/threonine kinase/phosphatase n=1 Tax=Microbulbifer zhoushanensis TaxID=2904254 RepID=UPI001F23992D|nr:bifunctional protein-serine/threonine kinase/phosphatase [Microbulbifer zhoushanensis]
MESLKARPPTAAGHSHRDTPGQLQVAIGQYSSAGRKAHNQDCHGATVPRAAQLVVKGIALALADGISSSRVSGIASETAVKAFLADYYCTSEAWSVRAAGTRVISAIDAWLDAQTRATQFRYQRDHGYVCTFAALVLRGRSAHLFHLGDSRIYRLHQGSLELLTSDHCKWAAGGERHLSRALGARDRDQPDYRQLPLQEGQHYILATDGLYEHISPQQVIERLSDPQANLDQVAQALVDAAQLNGSADNLTIQIARIDQLPGEGARLLREKAEQLPLPPILGPGEQLDGFRIERQLQISARSHAYLATDLKSGAHVFLKTPSTELGGDRAYLERLLMEEWVARRVRSTHLLAAAAIDRQRRYLYTVSEYIDGQTLAQWLRDNQRPDLERVRDITEQVARGLRALHRMEMLHRDLKPENIMLDRSGTVKLIDFGAVRISGLEELAGASGGNELLGTALYAAPECLLGECPTTRSDLYSLGVLTYHMLSGAFPYGPRMARARTVTEQRRLSYGSLASDNSAVPRWVDAAIRQAVHPDPFRRYAHLSEFVHDLRTPNHSLLSGQRPPLIERNPVAFWRGLAALQFVLILTLLYLLNQPT